MFVKSDSSNKKSQQVFYSLDSVHLRSYFLILNIILSLVDIRGILLLLLLLLYINMQCSVGTVIHKNTHSYLILKGPEVMRPKT